MNVGATTTEGYLRTLPEWQQDNLTLFRAVVHEADPSISEEIKWGVPTFLHGKIILFAMSAFKEHTKFNFIYNGALLAGGELFNNGLESKKSRAIDLKEGESVDRAALAKLVKAAVEAATS